MSENESLFAAPLTRGLQNFQRMYLLYHLRRNGWNVQRTADALKTNRSYLYKRIYKCGIELPRDAAECRVDAEPQA